MNGSVLILSAWFAFAVTAPVWCLDFRSLRDVLTLVLTAGRDKQVPR